MAPPMIERDLPFREIAEDAPQGILIHDGARALFVNRACARLLGFADPQAALAELDLARHFRPDDLTKLQAEWQRILTGHETVSWQRQRLRAVDGRLAWVELNLRSTRWGDQPAIQMLLLDGSGGPAGEPEPPAGEVRFRRLAESSIQGIVIHDGVRCLFANDAYARMMGFPDAQTAIAEAVVSQLVPSGDRAAIQADWRRLLAGEQTWSRQRELHQRLDGSPIWLDTLRGPVTWAGRPAVQVIQVDVSREVVAEAELRRGETLFRAVIDHLPAVLSLKGTDRRLLLVNREYERWHGVTAADVVGKTLDTIDLPAHSFVFVAPGGVRADDLAVLETKQPVTRESDRLNAGGERRQVITTKFPVFGATGAVEVIGTITTDITALKRAQAELEGRQAELQRNQATLVRLVREGLIGGGAVNERLGAIVHIASATMSLSRVGVWLHRQSPRGMDCMALWDAAAGRLRSSDEEASISFEEIKQRYTDDYFTRIGRDLVIAVEDIETDPSLTEAGRAFCRGKRIGAWIIARIQLPDQTLGVMTFAVAAPRRWSAEDAAFARSISDIMATTLLFERHRQALAALDLVDQGIYVEDERREVIYANRVARSLAGMPGTGAVSLDQLPALDSSAGAAQARGEILWPADEGSAFELAVARNAVPGLGAITVIADITERSQRERERSALEAQMRQAAKLEAVGRLAGGITHDFNNLLGAIMGFAGFLIEDLPEGTDQHDYASRIVKASQHAKEVVMQLLAFARATDVERQIVDLRSLILESGGLLRVSLPSSTRFVIDADGGTLPALVNEGQVHQLLLNLCINANDALDGQPGTIGLTLSKLDAGRHEGFPPEPRDGVATAASGRLQRDLAYARLTVADDGAGMDEATLARVFDPFFSTKGPGRGTGLGLAVVHGIVSAYDGAYMVESRAGQGTTFSIFLPLATGTADVDARARPAGALPGAEAILVVDDEPDVLSMMHIGLTRLGYRVTACGAPLEALELFRRTPDEWQLVMTDQVMPDMKGCTLIRKLREIRPDCPILLCTGFIDAAAEREASEAGARGIMQKPIDIPRLSVRMRALLDAQPAQTANDD